MRKSIYYFNLVEFVINVVLLSESKTISKPVLLNICCRVVVWVEGIINDTINEGWLPYVAWSHYAESIDLLFWRTLFSFCDWFYRCHNLIKINVAQHNKGGITLRCWTRIELSITRRFQWDDELIKDRVWDKNRLRNTARYT